MAGHLYKSFVLSSLILLILFTESHAKLSDAEPKTESDILDHIPEVKTSKKITITDAATMFAEEMKQTLERYLFGICPPTFKILLGRKNATSGTTPTPMSCDLDVDQQELAGRLATLALRVHSAARTDCSRLGSALANMLGELARTAANRQALINANEANKKRKLSKSQKAKIQAKQRTALAVKKKAAAAAAVAAAKTAGSS